MSWLGGAGVHVAEVDWNEVDVGKNKTVEILVEFRCFQEAGVHQQTFVEDCVSYLLNIDHIYAKL